MKKVLAISVCLFIAYSAVLFAQQVGPDTVNMKQKYAPSGKMKDVIFPHWTHQKIKNCADCHVEGTSLKDQMMDSKLDTSGDSKDVFHNQYCLACHKSSGAPTGCNNCHTGP